MNQNDDCVSRQAAINVAVDAVDDWDGGCNKTREEYIRKALETIPPVTPAEKVGYWMNGDDKCPCCGKSKFEGLDADIWADWQPKYCPNCGAKMREVEE